MSLPEGLRRVSIADPAAGEVDLPAFLFYRLPSWWKDNLREFDQFVNDLDVAASVSGKQIAADDAFVAVSKLWPERFKSYSAFLAWLKKHPEIRTDSPSENRRTIHAGDWVRYWSQPTGESESTDEDIEQYLAGVEERKAEVRAKKARR